MSSDIHILWCKTPVDFETIDPVNMSRQYTDGLMPTRRIFIDW
jgi:hypothetical protein